ncbi:MAG: hypothetical protein ACRDL0_21925 [Thermoleophilaceae bacterium]
MRLVIHLARRDPSLEELVADQLELTATERLGRLMPAGTTDGTLGALRWLANGRTPAIGIGGVAAVLQGGPQPPGDARVEFVSGDPYAMEAEMRDAGLVPTDTDERWGDVDTRAPWTLPQGGTLVLASNVPGTDDYRDLRRAARTVELGDGTSIRVAHPRDLLRMADASPRESELGAGPRFARTAVPAGRPPEPLVSQLAAQQTELLRALARHGVEFVVVGGVAAQIHG